MEGRDSGENAACRASSVLSGCRHVGQISVVSAMGRMMVTAAAMADARQCGQGMSPVSVAV
jgi:hypothetical protein